MQSTKEQLENMSRRRQLLCESLAKRRIELSKSFMTRSIAEELEPVEKLMQQMSCELNLLGQLVTRRNHAN